MKLPPLDLTKGQKRIVYLIVVTILAVPVTYLIAFFQHRISNKPGDWGPFGDFIGGLLNPILTFLTLIVTVIIALYLKKADDDKNAQSISASYQPQLVAEQTIFYTYYSEKFHSMKTVGFSKTPNPGLGSLHSPNLFGIDIYNIGLGPAKNITLRFEIDTNAILAALNQMSTICGPSERISIHRFPYPPHPDLLFFTYPAFLTPNRLQMPDVVQEEYVTHMLNVEISNKPFLYLFPKYLLELYTIFQYYWTEQMQHDANNLPTFPEFFLNVRYEDIGNREFKKEFQICLNSLQGGLSEFTNKITVKEIKL